MNVKASLNNLRTAPRKVRLVADVVRNKNVSHARSLLEFTTNKSSESILKLLNSALASALHDFKLQESNLYISKITVDEGPKLKRWHPMSRGRAYPIMKRTSSINLVLSERSEANPKNDIEPSGKAKDKKSPLAGRQKIKVVNIEKEKKMIKRAKTKNHKS